MVEEKDKDLVLALILDAIVASPMLIGLDMYERILNFNIYGSRRGVFGPSAPAASTLTAQQKAQSIITAIQNGQQVLLADAAWLLSQIYSGLVTVDSSILAALKKLFG